MDRLLQTPIGAAGGADPVHASLFGAARDERPGFCWHVLHTHSRQERAVAQAVAAAGAGWFLPVLRNIRYYGHRRRVVELPLFSCYLFVWGLVDHAFLAVRTRKVARVLKVEDQDRLGAELRQLRRALDASAALNPCDYLSKGRRVRVVSGPFEGLEGVVDEHLRDSRLVLQVHAIGRALSLEIDGGLLEPAD